MAREKIITSLDIGSSSVRVLVAKRNSKENILEVVLKAEEKSDGIRRGTVINKEKISEVLKNLFSKVSQDLNRQINSAYVNLSESCLFYLFQRVGLCFQG